MRPAGVTPLWKRGDAGMAWKRRDPRERKASKHLSRMQWVGPGHLNVPFAMPVSPVACQVFVS